VAAILRWRGVCKRWQALIDSTEFSKLQLNHSSSTTKNAFLFVLEDDGCGNGDLHFARYINGLRRETIPSFRSNPSPPAQIGVITLIGSCNGLVCFSNDADMAIITNPATQQTHVTPAIPNPLMDLVSIADCVYRYGCGFVYDSVSDDYKVIKLHQMLMLGFDANGQEILLQLDEKRLVWCDLKKNPPGVDASTEITVNGLKKKKKKNKNKKKYIDAIVCFGSLVSPGGMLPPKEQVKFDKQRKKRDGFLSAGFKLKL
ncbi:unnamed protein product, partial [Linum tenue]